MNDPEEKAQEKHKETPRQNFIMYVIAAVLLAFPAGYIVGAELAEDVEQMTMADDSSYEHSHSEEDPEASHSEAHEEYEIPDGAPVPGVDITVSEDTKSGWNLSMTISNFEFSPENAGQDHIDGQGHAHLYIDGKKVTRLYGPNYYIGELSEGEHQIRVTLNTNDHRDYTAGGEVIESIVTITDDHHEGEDIAPHTH
ncbi:MAG: hypothetical protein R3313_04785 [Candidatus Saccharimonadales bacterium]|nr:hypothetical protein [Candidatus Saccharimonadales bacterium]